MGTRGRMGDSRCRRGCDACGIGCGIGRITTTREDAMKAVSNSILGSALLAGCLVLASAPGSTASAQLKEVRMMEAGGASGESIEAGYLKPFTEKTGIEVVSESPWSMGKSRGIERKSTRLNSSTYGA